MYSQGVRGIVRFGEKVPAVPDDFVEALRHEVARQGAEEVLTVGPRIAQGEEVELAHGPLGGVRATGAGEGAIGIPWARAGHRSGPVFAAPSPQTPSLT